MLPTSPIIVIGAPRSGTTMIAKVLAKLGVFMGEQVDENHEPRFFLQIRDWLMGEVGCVWTRPATIEPFLQNERALKLAARYFEHALSTPRLKNFLGWGKYLRYRRLDKLPFPWGWKDPVTSIMLPAWREVFPDARIVYIRRNGVDVAQSLYVRLHRVAERADAWLEAPPWREARRPDLSFTFNIEGISGCWEMDETFKAWEGYSIHCDRHMVGFPTAQTMVLRYEDITTNPVPSLEALTGFLGLKPALPLEQLATEFIHSDSACKFRNKPELVEFYEKVRGTPMMVKYGYEDLLSVKFPPVPVTGGEPGDSE